MMGKKEFLAQMAVRTGAHRLIDKAHSLRYRDVKVLAYHRILPRTDEQAFPFDMELVSAWSDEFDWQIKYLAKHYEVVTCRELASYLDSGHWPDRPCALVTFDDGYLDNHDVALPILQHHRVPAVFYVATGYMGSSETFWYDRLAFDILQSPARVLTLQAGAKTIAIPADRAGKRQAMGKALAHLKLIPNEERLHTLLAWREALGVEAVPPQGGLHRPMDWPQVKAMSEAGMEIGSHTVSHPVLSRLRDAAELERELVESKAAIESCTGQPVLSLAYPTGGRHSYSEQVVDCIKRAGYRFAFTYEPSVNQPMQWDPYRLGRSAVERYVSRARFQAALAAPGFFS